MKMPRYWPFLGVLLLLALTIKAKAVYTSEAEADRVFQLPGWGSVEGFRLFSGYITVDEDAGRNTFYIFAEAASDPESAPVILWLNGGPGCSSVGGGFMSELGPWFPTPEGQLERNPHSWNHFANVLFIESPHGVGFSYSERHEDYTTGDARTAADSYEFLLRFFERFPQYADNDFMLAGESYAGHYVPQLAWEIVKPRSVESHPGGASRAVRKFRGFLLGNPWTDTQLDNKGAMEYWWSHSLISDATVAAVREYCNFTDIDFTGDRGGGDHPVACQKALDRAQEELGNINMYNIYADVCVESKRGGALRNMAKLLAGQPAGFAARVATAVADRAREAHLLRRSQGSSTSGRGAGALLSSGSSSKTGTTRGDDRVHFMVIQEGGSNTLSKDPPYDPCVDDEVEWYLNRPEVQKALHANQSESARKHLPRKWTDCSNELSYAHKDLLQSVLPLYDQLLKTGINMLVYSGDVDGNVPATGTRRWVAGLELPEKEAWRAWPDAAGQVGGYIIDYEGISFATVRGAGHMVPYTQPERMYHLAKSYVERTLSRTLADRRGAMR